MRVFSFIVLSCFVFLGVSCSPKNIAANVDEVVFKKCASEYRRVGAQGHGCVIANGLLQIVDDEAVFECAIYGEMLQGVYSSDVKVGRPDLLNDQAAWEEAKNEVDFQSSSWAAAASLRAELIGLDMRNSEAFLEHALRKAGLSEENASLTSMAKLFEGSFSSCRVILDDVSDVLFDVGGK